MLPSQITPPKHLIRQHMLRCHVDNAFRVRDLGEHPHATLPVYVIVCTDDEAGAVFARDVLKTTARGVLAASVTDETFESKLSGVVGPAVSNRVRQRLPGQVVMVCVAEGGITYYSPEQRVTVRLHGPRGLA